MISTCILRPLLWTIAHSTWMVPLQMKFYIFTDGTHTDAFTHRIFFTEQSLQRALCTHQSFFQRGLYTKQRPHFTHTDILRTEVFASGFYTEKLLHREKYREAVTHKGFYTHKPFCRAASRASILRTLLTYTKSCVWLWKSQFYLSFGR